MRACEFNDSHKSACRIHRQVLPQKDRYPRHFNHFDDMVNRSPSQADLSFRCRSRKLPNFRLGLLLRRPDYTSSVPPPGSKPIRIYDRRLRPALGVAEGRYVESRARASSRKTALTGCSSAAAFGGHAMADRVVDPVVLLAGNDEDRPHDAGHGQRMHERA